MLGSHVLNGCLCHLEKRLRVDPQADGLDRSNNRVVFKQEGAKQLLPRGVGKVPRIVLGSQPDGVDQRVNPAQPIKIALLERDQAASARHGQRPQYSSASMIVSTLVVTDESAGSGEWLVRLRSK